MAESVRRHSHASQRKSSVRVASDKNYLSLTVVVNQQLAQITDYTTRLKSAGGTHWRM